MYPDSNVWIIGHSLGGSLASLLGATFGVPALAFEAPGEAMAARRLHLPSPVRIQKVSSLMIFVLTWSQALHTGTPHPFIPYRRSHCDGNVQRSVIFMRYRGIRHGISVRHIMILRVYASGLKLAS